MRNAGLLIATVMLMMGCSKDKLITNEKGDNQLKKGSMAVIQKIEFYSTSSGTATWPIPEPDGDGIILENGYFSGNLYGYGGINSTLSTYQFAEPVQALNPDDLTLNFRECFYNYYLGFSDASGGATAKIYLAPSKKSLTTTSDYCTIAITKGKPYANYNLGPVRYEPGFSNFTSEFFGGLFTGEAIITNGAGKLQPLTGKKFQVTRYGGYSGINLTSGQVSLKFTEVK